MTEDHHDDDGDILDAKDLKLDEDAAGKIWRERVNAAKQFIVDTCTSMKKKRAADPDWLSFRDKTEGMVADQEDKIMTGTSFSPLK